MKSFYGEEDKRFLNPVIHICQEVTESSDKHGQINT